MAKYLPFLKSVWTVFSIDPQNVLLNPTLMNGWVDEKVYLCLSEFKSLSVSELTSLCETKGVTNESFEKTISRLNEDWSRFTPRAKDVLIQIIKIHKLEHLFNFELELTYEEQEELRIRWDISDILYFEKKQEAIKVWKEFGLDLEKGNINFSKANSYSRLNAFPEMMDNCTKIILSALRYKLESDLAVVSVAAPDNLRRFIERIKERLDSDYIELVIDLRVPLSVLISCYPDSIRHIAGITAELILGFAVCNAAQRDANYVAKETAALILELGVKKELEKLLMKIPETQPNSDVFSRVQEMIKSNS